MKLSEKSILLLLLYLNNREPIVGKTKFQKLVYVYDEEYHKQLELHKKLNLNEVNLFSFRPYHYGPFSDKLPISIKALVSWNYVKEKIEEDAFSFEDRLGERVSYELLDIGNCYVEEKILKYLDNYTLEKLSDFKSKYTKMSTREIIRYVYVTYEEMTVNSRIKDDVLNGEEC